MGSFCEPCYDLINDRDGIPTIVYAAVGKPADAAYAFSYGLAVPCNRSDPLLGRAV